MNFWRKLKIRFLRTDTGVLTYRHRLFLIQHQRRHKPPRICLQYNRISSLHTSRSILHYNSAFLDLDNFFQGHRNWSSVIAPELMSPENITAYFCFVLYFFPQDTLVSRCGCQSTACTLNTSRDGQWPKQVNKHIPLSMWSGYCVMWDPQEGMYCTFVAETSHL